MGGETPHTALIKHCKKDGIAFHEVIDTMGRQQKAKFVSEDKTLNESFTVNGTMGVLINESGIICI